MAMGQHLLQLFGSKLHLFYNISVAFCLTYSNIVTERFDSFSHLDHILRMPLASGGVLLFHLLK